MEDFETFLDQATAKSASIIPGAVVAVVDGKGNYVYKKVSGRDGSHEDALTLTFDRTYYLASCTKLIASIAALQLVDKGLIELDEPLDSHLPELSSQPIVTQTGNGELKYEKATKSITLRDLVTHSSGSTYDWLDPTMQAWRASRGEVAAITLDGDVLKGHTYPRRYEAGTSWNYSGGLDWTSLLVERLTDVSFEEYVEDNIARPLDITSFTWHLPRKPTVAAKVARMSTRKEDGTLADGPNPFSLEPVKEAGGLGMYANVHDYTRVLADLLRDSPKLLKKSSVDDMFSPQFAPGSSALHDLRANGGSMYQCALDDSMQGVVANHGLAGLLMEQDVRRENYFRPAGTLSWSGLPNLSWSINRDRGLATFFATQVLPWADRRTWNVVARFETAVWSNLSV